MTHYVNSEAIFSTIGDYPVVDQFDVLYSDLAAGSTYDNYITGSLLTKFKFGAYDLLVPGERGLAFSKLGVNQTARPTPLLTTNAAYALQPWRERAGIIRNVRIFSSDERYYDSLTPSINDFFSALGGKIIKVDYSVAGLGVHNAIFLDNDSYNPFEETTGLSPVGFERSFPFEPNFSKVKRNKNLNNSFVSTSTWDILTNTETQTNPFKTKTLLICELNSGSHFSSSILSHAGGLTPSSSFNANYWIDDISYVVFGNGTREIETSKILFGFGDRNSLMKKSNEPPLTAAVIGQKNLVERRISADLGSYQISLGAIIRGWKYGLIDGNPHYTSCVFRRDKFGQFRDLLEQRPFAAVIIDENNSPLNYSIGVEKPALPPGQPSKTGLPTLGASAASLPSISNLSADRPIRVNFTRQSYIESTKELLYFSEQPQNTWSSNLSEFATSSLPYFDDVSRNRNPITNNPSSTIISSLSDLFGNKIMGA